MPPCPMCTHEMHPVYEDHLAVWCRTCGTTAWHMSDGRLTNVTYPWIVETTRRLIQALDDAADRLQPTSEWEPVLIAISRVCKCIDPEFPVEETK